MEPFLESFESFLYVLVNTLPVGIGIGLVFFGVGFLFTNPRLRRAREQVAAYKEEVARMSRMHAQVASRHQELLEDLQAKENENLLLYSTLETRDEELIGLLDRLNSIAVDSEPASADAGAEALRENARLRQRIAELTGRLRTTESALQDRKIELTRARRDLARVGVREEAIAPAGAMSSDEGRWRSARSTSVSDILEAPAGSAPARDDAKPDAPDAGREREAVDAILTQQTGLEDTDTGDAAQAESGLDESAARNFIARDEPSPAISGRENDLSSAISEWLDTELSPGAGEGAGDSGGSPGPGAAEIMAEAELDLGALPSSDASDASDFEDQLAEFEERLRAKEAEFFALQDQLSLGIFARDRTGSIPGSIPGSKFEAAGAPPQATAPLSGDDLSQAATPAPTPAAEAGPAAAAETGALATPSEEKAREVDTAPAAPPFPALTVGAAPVRPSPAKPAHSVAPSWRPAPGEQVIFRGSDPALWSKAAGKGLVPVEQVSKSTRFLRLRRVDSGASVILRVAKKELLSTTAPGGIIGWNGAGDQHKGARHLGIFDHSLPQEIETKLGAGGWGFGHFSGNREGQGCAWAGVSIPKTGFEISALPKLPDARELKETSTTVLEGPSIPPSADGELVFFHSAYPEIWNRNTVDGKGGFAFHFCRLPEKTRYVKVRRSDNGSEVVIPVSRSGIVLKGGGENGPEWNGSNEFFFAGHHLGICDPSSAREVEIAYGCGGYGFGHLVDSNDRQAVAWAGKHIARTALEFIAIARDLTSEEQEQLLRV